MGSILPGWMLNQEFFEPIRFTENIIKCILQRKMTLSDILEEWLLAGKWVWFLIRHFFLIELLHLCFFSRKITVSRTPWTQQKTLKRLGSKVIWLCSLSAKCIVWHQHQKQPPEVFCNKKRSSWKFHKIYRKTPAPESLF